MTCQHGLAFFQHTFVCLFVCLLCVWAHVWRPERQLDVVGSHLSHLHCLGIKFRSLVCIASEFSC